MLGKFDGGKIRKNFMKILGIKPGPSELHIAQMNETLERDMRKFNDKMDALGYGVEARKRIQEHKDKQFDTRYNTPKEAPKAEEKLVEETIEETEIYRKAKERILKAQRKQVAYGLDKYPTPLSADVWDIHETVDHILDEAVDQLHYLVMLQIHLKRLIDGPQMVMKTPGTESVYADGVAIDEYVKSDIEATRAMYEYMRGIDEVEEERSKLQGDEHDGDIYTPNMNFEDTPKVKITNIIPQPSIIFSNGGKEILNLDGNGDIFVKGRLVENDLDIVTALREFLEFHKPKG